MSQIALMLKKRMNPVLKYRKIGSNMDHYSKTLYIPEVDRDDKILGKVERWEAHKKGILHRAFDIIVYYKGEIILQHRKHPVYDGFLTFTATSHQYFIDGKFQELIDGVYATLKREWNIEKEDLSYAPKYAGKIYYKSTDGKYFEHEICHYYVTEVAKLPPVNFEYAYGFSLVPVEKIRNQTFPAAKILAPWVEEAIKQKIV